MYNLFFLQNSLESFILIELITVLVIMAIHYYTSIINKVRISIDKIDYSRNGIIHKNIIDWLLNE